MQRIYDTIFKLDSKKKTRIWFMEQEDNKYRTTSGLADGKQTTTAWTIVGGKNLGRSNETSPTEQATAEILATYTKKLEKDYHKSVKDIANDRFFKVMLADTWEKRMAKIDYSKDLVWIQPKLDGVRSVTDKDWMQSRGGKEIITCPHIMEAVLELDVFKERPNLKIDGELYNHRLKEDFNTIISLVKRTKPTAEDLARARETVQYYIYDVFDPDEPDMLFEDRLALRRGIIADMSRAEEAVIELGVYTPLVGVPTIYASSEAMVDEEYDVWAGPDSAGYEGGIIRINAPYKNGRSKHLLKRKDFDDEEFEIVRIEEGSGNWAGYAKKCYFQNNKGEYGVVGSSITGNQAYLKEVLANKDKYIGKQVTIKFFGRTPDKEIPRFPIAKALHLTKRM